MKIKPFYKVTLLWAAPLIFCVFAVFGVEYTYLAIYMYV